MFTCIVLACGKGMHWQTHSRQWGDGCGGWNVLQGEECGCILESLRKQAFGARSFEEKKNIIAIRQPIPDLPNTKTRTKRCIRHFNSEHYNKIIGCADAEKFPDCTVRFLTENTVWVSTGFEDMNNLLEAANHHKQFQAHIRAEISLTTFITSRIEFQLDQQRKKDIIKHN